MLTPKDIQQKLKSIKPRLQADFSVDKIGYFGSFANEDYHDDSDVDVLVSFNGKVGWKFFDLKEYLEQVLQRKVDLVTESSLKRQWKDAILQQVRYI